MPKESLSGSYQRPHIILLGDRTKAARWVGYAKGQFEVQAGRYGPEFQTSLIPREDTRIEMRQFGGIKKIIITVTPPIGPTFVGVPTDSDRYGSWGSPFGTEDEDEEIPRTTKGIPYGTEFSNEDKPALLIPVGRSFFRKANRYPQYVTRYPEFEYGTISWDAENYKTRVSWDGLNSRHRGKIPNQADIFFGHDGGWCEDENTGNGLLRIGNVVTGNNTCIPGVLPQKILRVIGVSENAGQNIADYTTVNALSGKVYKDGELLWDFGDEWVSAACVITLFDEDNVAYRALQVIIGEFHDNLGILNESFVRINLNTGEEVTRHYLENYNTDLIPVVIGNEEVIWPYRNANCGAFSSDGTVVMLLRDFITVIDSTLTIEVRCTEYTVVEKKEVPDSNLSLASPTPEISEGVTLWSSFDEEAFRVTQSESTEDQPNFTRSKALLKGNTMIQADYVKGEPVFAFIYSEHTFETNAVQSFTDPCNKVDIDHTNTREEYLYFSKSPEVHIHLVTRNEIILESFGLDLDPDYTNRINYTAYIQNIITAIDARFETVVLGMRENAPWWELRGGNSDSPILLQKYEPKDNLKTTTSLKTYTKGKIIWESEVLVETYSYNYLAPPSRIFPCSFSSIDFAPYVLGDSYFPDVLEQIPYDVVQIQAASVSMEVADAMITGFGKNLPYKPVGYIMRYNKVTGEIYSSEDIVKTKAPILLEVEKILQIGDYYNSDDVVVYNGAFTNTGVI